MVHFPVRQLQTVINGHVIEGRKKKNSLDNLGHAKKSVIHAAMIVPCCTLRSRAEMLPLKNGLYLRQACSVHRESGVRLNSCESFGPMRMVCQKWPRVEMMKIMLVNLVQCFVYENFVHLRGWYAKNVPQGK